MKKQFQYLKLFFAIVFIPYTLTTTAANIISSKALIDLPELSDNKKMISILFDQ